MASALIKRIIPVLLLWPAWPAAQDRPQSDLAIAQGAERFARNCAICHGEDARGLGLYLRQLTVKPPNLRLLARNNGGEFPLRRVYDSIDGRSLPAAHGTADMPIWGETFKGEVARGAETLVRGRILEIILYLESIQER